MMRRAATMAFAPGMYVFPGGRVDPVDARAGDPFAACAVRELSEEASVRVHVDDLVRIDHWVTPEDSPIRYDVQFFVVHLPDGQHAQATGTEMDRVEWLRPSMALAMAEDGRMPMLIPTVRVLALLDRYPSIAALRSYAAQTVIRPQLPRRRAVDSGVEHWIIVDAHTEDVLEHHAVMPPLWETGGTQ